METLEDYINNLRGAIFLPESDNPKEALKRKCGAFRKLLETDSWLSKLPVDVICVGLFDQIKFNINGEHWKKGIFGTPAAKKIIDALEDKIKKQVLYVLYVVKGDNIKDQFELGGDSIGLEKESEAG